MEECVRLAAAGFCLLSSLLSPLSPLSSPFPLPFLPPCPCPCPPQAVHRAGFGSCFYRALQFGYISAHFLLGSNQGSTNAGSQRTAPSSFSAPLLEKNLLTRPREQGSRGDSQPQQENRSVISSKGPDSALGHCPAAQSSTPGNQAPPVVSLPVPETTSPVATVPAGLAFVRGALS